jgi:predicted kinase
MRKPVAYILVGVPASGKSTWIKNQPWASDCVYISTDHHVDNIAATAGKTYNEVFTDAMPDAVRAMAQDVVDSREQSKDIIWDQTSTTVKSRKKKFNMLPDYKMIAIVFRTPEQKEHQRRLNSRPEKSIPDHVVNSMIDGFEMPTVEEGFDEVWFA